ncbi:lysophospholipase L1-like esterase [Aureibacillus halotolerans]|uniref:Lysophospholipase L1-like esterase n=2 Tax=Aureibacillus halotolerans TaxID=1508390 RepID=A0A4R6UHZ2_9BACI|nr:lysophospholipase L1-like esterase [Aureibacillus halotolerans]
MKPPIRYLAIGDSLTVGVGGSIFSTGFIGPYATVTTDTLRIPVQTHLLAKSGRTSGELYSALKTLPTQWLTTCSLVTITAGSNDMLRAARTYMITKDEKVLKEALSQIIHQLKKMITFLYSFQPTHPPLIRIANLYNPWPHDNVFNTWVVACNSALLSLETPRIAVADVYAQFEGNIPHYLSFDDLHPNDAGYRAMAYAFYKEGYEGLKTQ